MALLFDRDTQKWDLVDVARPAQYQDRSPDLLDVYTVAPGDAVPGMSGERCEGKAFTDGDPGEKQRFKWQTRFPTNFQPNPDTLWNFWTQWHAASSTLQAPVALTIRTYSGEERLKLRLWPGVERYYDLGTIDRNIAVDWRADIQWDSGDGGGFVRIFKNTVLVAEDFGQNTYPGDSGTYVKQGFYRGPSTITTSIFHGHMRVTTFL